MVHSMPKKVAEATAYIASKALVKPKIAVILGSGLGALADEIVQDRVEIKYEDIPYFPVADVQGHENKLIIGKIYDKDVIMLQGRFHYYEGYEMDELTIPIRVLAFLGVEQLILTNAAAGISKHLKLQDLMLITDHINISCNSPLRGPNYEAFGTRFPSMKNAYSKRLIDLAKNVASLKAFDGDIDKKYMKFSKDSDDVKFDLKEGVYAYMPGPQYETDAEIKMLGILGADAVGMSTVPEVIVGAHMGLEVLGISCITNIAGVASNTAPSHSAVLENANAAEEKFKNLLMRIIMKM